VILRFWAWLRGNDGLLAAWERDLLRAEWLTLGRDEGGSPARRTAPACLPGQKVCPTQHWWYEDREGETVWVGPCANCGADV
jgi:hypothetical protein